MFLLPGIAITVIRTLFIISDMTNNTSAFSFAITFVAQQYPGLVSGFTAGAGDVDQNSKVVLWERCWDTYKALLGQGLSKIMYCLHFV